MTPLNTSRPKNYIDGCNVDSIDPEILKAIEGYSSRSVEGRRVSFVGVVWSENDVAVFYPKGLSSDDNWQNTAKLIIRCIRQYTKNERKSSDLMGVDNRIKYPIGLSVLENYLKFGLYNLLQKKAVLATSGKVDWKNTLNRIMPTHNKDRVPIYIPQIVGKTRSSPNIIQELHKAIISEADKVFGWLIGSKSNLVAPELKGVKLPVSKTAALKIIRKEMSFQYVDAKISQLKLMESFLLNKEDTANQSRWCFGTDLFQNIWENMCASYLGDQKSQFPMPAIPAYKSKNALILKKENASRPDIIINEKNKIAIVDAKYYDFKASMPGWQDLVKQFFYAKAFTIVYKKLDINNMLAVPKVEKAEPESIVVVDRFSNQLDDEFPPMDVLFLDMVDVMKCFEGRRISVEKRALALD